MAWNNPNRKVRGALLIIILMITAVSCTVSYKFNGSSINYDKVKTISIADFPIKATYVYAPMGTLFNQELKDIFLRQTRLRLVSNNGDMDIEGEITGYTQFNEAVAADGFASKTRVTMTVNVRFVNNSNHAEDFDGQQFSAFRTYDSKELLTAVQDELISQMVKDIVDQIFNATAANW